MTAKIATIVSGAGIGALVAAASGEPASSGGA